MATKKIQLRGISRTPSDRMTEDGGVAESLNVQLMDGETAPMPHPEDVSQDLGLPEELSAKRFFIHKTSNYENLIAVTADAEQDYVRVIHIDKGIETVIVEMEYIEAVKDIISIGNILVIATSDHMRYAVFKGGKYKYLGERIPEPQIEFRCRKAEYREWDAPPTPGLGDVQAVWRGLLYDAKVNYAQVQALDPEAWKQAITDISLGIETDETKALLDIQNEMWAMELQEESLAKKNKVFLRPILARYAVKLYDGTYIYQSVPILLGAGYDNWLEVKGYYLGPANSAETGVTTWLGFKPYAGYKALAKLMKWDVSGWEDIVQSVDVFLSTDICLPAKNAAFGALELESTEGVYMTYKVKFNQDNLTDLQASENEILSKSNFYKIASFSTGGLSKLTEGYDIHDGKGVTSQDTLVLQDRLPDYEQSGTEIVPSRLYAYNGRVLAVGGSKLLPNGYRFLQSTNILDEAQTSKSYAFNFIVNGSDGVRHKIVPKNVDGGEMMQPYKIDGSYAKPYGLIFFPDPRCSEARIWLGEYGDVAVLEMKPHPFLNCSYAFWGLSKTIEQHDGQVAGDVLYPDFIRGENRNEIDTQKLYQSEANNPFYFPLSGNLTLQSDIKGIAAVTTALSQGQFGQFDLYTFTEDGIWVNQTKADGTLSSSKQLSREVCVNPDSITPIDQAVVFVTDKGVMYLSGSQITELSPNMNGRHYVIEETAKTIIQGQDFFCDMLPALSDKTHFMAFVKQATISYDYAGKRLVFIKKGEKFQYIYKLDTQTWHKMYMNVDLIAPLNSYPEALVQGEHLGRTKIYDLSTILDAAEEQTPTRGVIATRPFDLGEPDVLKAITDVRIRGQFPKGAVKFILLGSNDGINFATLSTLRGRAWKMFRMIILADLAPTDRISWIDVQYETKFTNRLR